MNNPESLERAILTASEAHQGQKDKASAPYILHPLKLMLCMDTETEMMAAVLHDVLEDSDWTPELLRAEGFPDKVVAVVECLTHMPGESYDQFIGRVRTDTVARRVKIADLEHNMVIRRCREFTGVESAGLCL